MSHAYHQIVLDEESIQYVILNTHTQGAIYIHKVTLWCQYQCNHISVHKARFIARNCKCGNIHHIYNDNIYIILTGKDDKDHFPTLSEWQCERDSRPQQVVLWMNWAAQIMFANVSDGANMICVLSRSINERTERRESRSRPQQVVQWMLTHDLHRWESRSRTWVTFTVQ